jgi:hypothetical protein
MSSGGFQREMRTFLPVFSSMRYLVGVFLSGLLSVFAGFSSPAGVSSVPPVVSSGVPSVSASVAVLSGVSLSVGCVSTGGCSSMRFSTCPLATSAAGCSSSRRKK